MPTRHTMVVQVAILSEPCHRQVAHYIFVSVDKEHQTMGIIVAATCYQEVIMAAGPVVLGQGQATMVAAVEVPPILPPQVVFSHPSLLIPIPYFSLLVAVAAHPITEMAAAAVEHPELLVRALQERNHQAVHSCTPQQAHTPVVNVAAVAAAGTAAMAEHLRMSLVVVAAAISAAVLLMLKPLQAMPLCRIRMAVP